MSKQLIHAFKTALLLFPEHIRQNFDFGIPGYIAFSVEDLIHSLESNLYNIQLILENHIGMYYSFRVIMGQKVFTFFIPTKLYKTMMLSDSRTMYSRIIIDKESHEIVLSLISKALTK